MRGRPAHGRPANDSTNALAPGASAQVDLEEEHGRAVRTHPPEAVRRRVPGLRVPVIRPEVGRGYPLNLSILLSGGKETNQDSLSNGE